MHWSTQSGGSLSCAVRASVVPGSSWPRTSRRYWRQCSHLKHETPVSQTHTLLHDEVVGVSGKVHWVQDTLNICRLCRDPLLCEWLGRRVGSFASLIGREAASELERRVLTLKLAEESLVLAQKIVMTGMMHVDAMWGSKTCCYMWWNGISRVKRSRTCADALKPNIKIEKWTEKWTRRRVRAWSKE
jgi:hypothetical protein